MAAAAPRRRADSRWMGAGPRRRACSHRVLGRCGHPGRCRAGGSRGGPVLSRHHRPQHGRGPAARRLPGRGARAGGRGDLGASGPSPRSRHAAAHLSPGRGRAERVRRRAPSRRRGVRRPPDQPARRSRMERLGARRALGSGGDQSGQPVETGVLAGSARRARRLSVQSGLRACDRFRPARGRHRAVGRAAAPAQRRRARRRRCARLSVVRQSVPRAPQLRPARLSALGRSGARRPRGSRCAGSRSILHGPRRSRPGRRVLLQRRAGGREMADG